MHVTEFEANKQLKSNILKVASMAIGDSGEGAASIHTIPTRTEDSSQTKNTMNTINQEGFPEWQPRQSTTSNMNKEQN